MLILAICLVLSNSDASSHLIIKYYSISNGCTDKIRTNICLAQVHENRDNYIIVGFEGRL